MHAIRARRFAAVAWTLAAMSGCGGSSAPPPPPPPECTQAGDCPAVASGTAACVNGTCAVGACDAGFADCDGQRADGCEVDTSSSLAHCGACNQACAPANADGACAAGQCTVATCTPPFFDCDGLPSNGCECVLRASHDGITVFNQTAAAQDGEGVSFPGQANFWDLDGDFSLRDGGNRQFAGALVLKVGGLEASAAYFPGDQTFAELGFLVPEFTAADGVRVAAVSGTFDYLDARPRAPLAGSFSAWLASTSDSRLSQPVDLAGASGTITLAWTDAAHANLAAVIPGQGSYYRVVVRDTGGAQLATAFTAGSPAGWPATSHAFDLSAFAGQRVTVSFELRGPDLAMVAVDEVSVTAGGPNLVVNGTFESGDLSGWAASTPSEPQNVASGTRTVAGLRVTRTVYAPPAALWARWLDVYENAGAADVVTTAWYETALGSAGNGVTTFVDGSGGLAVSSWDTCSAAPACAPGTRDVGLAFGLASGVAFATAPDLSGNNWALSDLVTWHHPLVVPAGGRVALVHFLVMDGADTGMGATSVAARAATVDAQDLAIATGFWRDPRYRAGMTQAQIDAVANWPRECVQASDCQAIPHGTPACASGACAVGACDAGFDDCNGSLGDGCETDLASDAAHCAACGMACPAVAHGTPGCASGACGVGSCVQPWGDCDASPGNGCEADTGTSLAHCGACNATCAPPNATGVCAAGSCGVGSCAGTFEDCDGLPGNGCERDLTSDVDHCGLCSLACAVPNATPACIGGLCTIAACDAAFADCRNGAADGCETNTSIDLASCGGCNLACGFPNATAACLNGICSFAGCLLPYASCNGIEADGCEVDTSSDPLHCGTCAPCAAVANGVAGCTSGFCGIASCDAGFADCVNGAADGCETNVLTDASNCGGCGVVCAGGVCSGGACAPVITAVSPAWGSVEGGEMVLVTGADFTGATSAVVGGFTVAATVGGGGTTLAFVSPAHAPGAADVAVTNGAGRTATATGAFEYLLALAPGRTIAVDGQAGDWTGDYQVASESTATDWPSNALRALSVAFDATHLYLGIDGETALGAGNALLVYLDRDAGLGTGIANLETLGDGTGFLDDACSGSLNATGVAGFGAEFCLGTVDMTSVAVAGGPAGLDKAGLRDVVTNPADFAWAVDGTGASLVAVAAPGGLGAWVEIAVPWTSIYGTGGLPAPGTSLSLFVRAANSTGALHANQSLPSQGGAAVETVTAVFTFRAR